ncbi:MAG: hypothetical protein A4E35_00397 [Methanoregula sp. PtaU1.Bin051]|nr:MAG: hypothetical protein A4E35_00397 [Methanoregula sp. PtaU1.Bin051]
MDPGHRSVCRVCGDRLEYGTVPGRATCYFCGESHETETICRQGHFVCDRCRRAPAEEIISSYCRTTTETDPIAIARTLMNTPQVKMHGPEHHFLVPAVLLAAYYNVTGTPDLKMKKIEQARSRAELIKDGFCGSHGDCGAAVGTGIFVSLATGATPLSREEWRLSNLVTAKSLEAIAMHGGPRCCKRNAFLAILAAVDFVREHFGIEIPVRKPVTCGFSALNEECLTRDCLFYE